MDTNQLKVLCNRCDIPAQTDRRNDDVLHVHCPACGKDFGTVDSVNSLKPNMLHQPYLDLDGWRVVAAA